MSFLILDTDKQSTDSLKLQLDALGDGPIRELFDAAAYRKLRTKNLPPPLVILLDRDGDPERAEEFRQDLETIDPSSVVIYLGTERPPPLSRSQDCYLRKPVFRRKLERAVVRSYARGQERRSGIGYVGGKAPPELVHELPHVSRLWRQLFPVEAKEADASFLGKIGVLFILSSAPRPIGREELELVRRLYRFTSASRILLVGVGVSPEQTRDLRNFADYFVPFDAEWKPVLRSLAARRLNRLASQLMLKDSRRLLALGKVSACERKLKRVLREDPWNLTAHGRLADLAFSRGKYKAAEAGYRRILELNPCQPRAYLRLLEIEKKTKGSCSEETLERARSYCPGVPEIRDFARKAEARL